MSERVATTDARTSTTTTTTTTTTDARTTKDKGDDEERALTCDGFVAYVTRLAPLAPARIWHYLRR
jgi:hypothetical protein